LPISAVDTVTLAFQHTRRQLIQPFRFWQWTRLAAVGLLAGEAGSAGGSFHFPTSFPQQPSGSSRHLLAQEFPHIDPAVLGTLITVLVVSALVFAIVMMYVSSVMRFILFDSIVAKECHIRQGWGRRQTPGWRYFLWQLGLTAATIGAFVILLGIPAGIGFAMGWFNEPRQHLLPLIVGGIVLFFVLMILIIVVAVIEVLTKDFVVPQMALEGIGAIEGWRRLWPMIQTEMGGYGAYVGMKIVLAIGAGIVIGIASFVLLLFILIPVAGVWIGAIVGGKAAGLTWNIFTITVAVVAGCVMLAILFYLTALISVPVIVFFPAYSIYFFAPRYRPLSLVLYPPPPPPTVPTGGPPQEPPPLLPELAV
jgi:hypothetical protein